MKWLQRAKIKLVMDSLRPWGDSDLRAITELILREFHLDEGTCRLEVSLLDRETKIVEFTAMLSGESPSAMALAERLEHSFLDSRILKREVSYEKLY